MPTALRGHAEISMPTQSRGHATQTIFKGLLPTCLAGQASARPDFHRLSLAGTRCLRFAPEKCVFADRSQCRWLSPPVLGRPQKSTVLPTEPNVPRRPRAGRRASARSEPVWKGVIIMADSRREERGGEGRLLTFILRGGG